VAAGRRSHKGLEWQIITGEYPPQPGGVGDYTYRLAEALAQRSEDVHIWVPASHFSQVPAVKHVEVHRLPAGFGLQWLLALDRGLAAFSNEQTVLVQYVPHMYGWKAMNIAFCCWLAARRHRKVWVMFHEVAFPFKSGQPWRHKVLAVTHRLMAWIVLHSAQQSFTSIEPYRNLLSRIAPKAKVHLLRLFSNVPFGRSEDPDHHSQIATSSSERVVGMFSSFGAETWKLLEETLPNLLGNSSFKFLMIGPGSSFIEQFCRTFPEFKGRVSTTGRVNALQAGSYLQACNVLLQLYPEGACVARGTLVAAMASGVPVVTTSGPLTGSLLGSSGALAFADAEPLAICRVLEDLLADPLAARRLGAAGRRLYETDFDIAVTVATLRQMAGATS
jgi:glycosyltransferase involved in cell wall biosynthesis